MNPAEIAQEVETLIEPLALLNLLTKAVKFTTDGGVRLDLEPDGGGVACRITDTGPGIAAEHLERIFEPFWQVEGSATRAAGGTWLGLIVARRLARLLGGDIDVASTVGRGTAFTVRLPADAP